MYSIQESIGSVSDFNKLSFGIYTLVSGYNHFKPHTSALG